MQLEQVAGLLPETIQQIAGLIGLPRTLELVAALGGTTFPVPKNQRRLGQVRYEALAEVIGVDGADALTRHFGGEILSIPKCEAALRELRDRLRPAGAGRHRPGRAVDGHVRRFRDRHRGGRHGGTRRAGDFRCPPRARRLLLAWQPGHRRRLTAKP